MYKHSQLLLPLLISLKYGEQKVLDKEEMVDIVKGL
jgi:hypothetical protein